MGGESTGGRGTLRAAAVALCVIGTGVAVPAQDANLASLRLAAAAASARFVAGFGNIVAVEQYVETGVTQRDPRRVRSDYRLVRFPGHQLRLLEFRDVREVDGREIPGREERSNRLFLAPVEDAYRRAVEIGEASAGYLPTQYRPLIGLTYLQAEYQRAFHFRAGGVDRVGGAPSSVLEFEHNRDVPLELATGGRKVSGRAWLDLGAPAMNVAPTILRTRVALGEGRRRVELVTSFGRDERLGIGVPTELQILDANGQTVGVLTYQAFQRFDVETDAVLSPRQRP